MTTSVEIRVPAEQSEGTRSQVLRWLKAVGEPVAENEPLIEIETDKVTVEVAAPGTGVLREILKGEQEEVGPGELLGRIERNDAAGIGAEDARVAANRITLGSEREATTSRAGTTLQTPIPADTTAATRPGPADTTAAGRLSPADTTAASRLSPAVRRLLAEQALDAARIRGTGQGGRITVDDVMLAVAAQAGSAHGAEAPMSAVASTTSGALPTSASGAAGALLASRAPAGEVSGKSHLVPHSAVRRRIAEHMVQSLLHTAPHVTTVFEADMSAVLAHRQRQRDDFARRGAPLTLTAYFLQAAVQAIRAVPEANSRWTDTALEVFDSIHIGVATALENVGLVVPVLREVESLDLFGIAKGLNDLVTRAREGRLSPGDVRGGTFTISNHGVSGSLIATPIVINQPQAAILGVGKLEKRAVVLEDAGEERVVIRPQCYVSLTIDHRVMDGHQANRFLRTFVESLGSWPAQ